MEKNTTNIYVVLKQCIGNKLDILSLWTRYVKHFTSISYARECIYDLLHVKRRIIKSLTIQSIPIHMKSGLPLFPLLCSTSAKYALAEIKLLDLIFLYTAKRQKLRNYFCFLSNCIYKVNIFLKFSPKVLKWTTKRTELMILVFDFFQFMNVVQSVYWLFLYMFVVDVCNTVIK